MVFGLLLLAGTRETAAQAGHAPFDSMQALGTHRFDDLPDGGRIELQRSNSSDTAGIRLVREHLTGIARAFAAGDFTTPTLVHAESVPGTATMKARRERISYDVKALPRGGEIRIRTRDRVALRAVHAFLAYQRRMHQATGIKHSH
jgi:hypothetical protein